MFRSFFSALGIFLLAQMLCAQNSTPGVQPDLTAKPGEAHGLAAGTILTVELSKALDARKLKIDEKIEVRTTVDLLSHGQIVMARNTKIIGRVTEVKAHSKQSPESALRLVFERAVMKDGRELPLRSVIQAIGRPLQSVSSFSSGDPMGANATGMPAGSQSQRGEMAGSVSTGAQFPNQRGYPPGNVNGLPSDSADANGSTVSPLGPTSKGVIGMKNLALDSAGPASVVSCKTDNVHLDGRTQLILRVESVSCDFPARCWEANRPAK